MAPSRTQKKAPPAAKKAAKPAPKPAARKPAAKAPAAKTAKPAKPAARKSGKPAGKAAPAAKPKSLLKPATKAAKPAKPVKASKPAAPTKAAAPTRSAKDVPAPRRAVAASHRPQASAVAVQPRPSRKAGDAKAPVPAERSGGMLTDDSIRRASEAEYMNDQQLAFFTERLLQMRNEVLTREIDVKERLHQREVFADPADRASAEEEHWLDLRLRERESLLLKKIDEALRRIRDREYGYCEKTGEPIGIARLLARPTATVCVDVKGQDERAESQFRDR